MEGSWVHLAKWKKTIWMVTYCRIQIMWHFRNGKNYGDRKFHCSRNWGQSGMLSGVEWSLSMKPLCFMPQWWRCGTQCHFWKSVYPYMRNDYNVNCECWRIMKVPQLHWMFPFDEQSSFWMMQCICGTSDFLGTLGFLINFVVKLNFPT